ncbi:site-specific DNA-methyltransferase [Psychrobacter sp. DM4]|uniref:site-specific DNA-methyltransferase n=1 Tax=Psychrobacter sp. DM4 TaxID=3440637 RepID=UPI003F4FB36F
MSNDQINVEHYKFEPIKGYPMLNWQGKRPFRSTQYFPAQLKEVYGQEDDSGWINKIFWGDNLQVMSHLLKEFRGKVDLIYIDPPFDSKADYKKVIKLKGKSITNDANSFEEKQYTDIWSNDDYLQFMYERLVVAKELLAEDGKIIVHIDYRKSSHIKCIMDEVFGFDRFRNEIIWHYSGWLKASTSQFARKHDNLLFYVKNDTAKINITYESWVDAYSLKELKKMQFGKDTKGDFFIDNNQKIYLMDILSGYLANRKQAVHEDDIGQFVYADGRNTNKRYLKDVLLGGKAVDDVWDIKALTTSANERVGYPTQKPEELVERIIEACSNSGGLVFDFFMGSGTTQAVAHKLGRKFIGADINLGAVQTTTKRLSKEKANFEVFNVNNYEIFRNPVEAKELLIEALEIQKLDATSVYDGEKDGYKVKIMPVNRIATKEDLNELIANFPYKQFESRKEANPNQSVEEIMLVCMGHEPSLGATLENESGYKLKVQVVDILRDKSDLTFKYDSEAAIKIEGNKLVVEAFYPRNLLQKLSQQKDDVEEWREMVESIMIDWNFDGAVMEPVVIDIPPKDEFVVGEYEIPEGASNIKVKITDLLSESYEEVIVHG